VKTAISIPDTLFEAAERAAERLGLSRSELYRRALTRYLEERTDEVIRERLDRVYGEAEEASRLDRTIEYLQNESLDKEDW
jgi:metal-responsive CopG/Arc/MetJ family transcriptional regulator